MFKIKTLVELFDLCQVENVIAGLKFKPERIVYVGFKSVMTHERIKAIKELFGSLYKGIKIEFEIVGRYDIDAIVSRFEYINEKYEDCYFDMTGGREVVLTALGIFMERKNIPVFQFDVVSEKFINIKNCENMPKICNTSMTIKEALKLSSSSYIDGESGDFTWDFTQEFREDVRKIWKTASLHCGEWNRQSNAFDYLEAVKKPLGSLSVNVRSDNIPPMNERIVSGLLKSGLIYDYEKKEDRIAFKYKNHQVKKCITKAGNILEVYAGMLIYEINEEIPGCYDDIDISVYIDWDGVVHPDRSGVKDTKNEVDIMVMKNLIPVFISCKNGEVHKEALYELDTVASRFGGKYAKKILFATYINSDKTSYEYIIKRAEDMNIKVVSDMHKKSEKQLKEEIKRVLK